MNSLEKSADKTKEKQRIKFDENKETLLIDVDRDKIDFSKFQEKGKVKELAEKNEIHLTIIGSHTAKTILSALEQIDPQKKQEKLQAIKELINKTSWEFNLRPSFYYIEKKYNDPDPQNPEKTIPEIRKSIIQMADIANLREFYKQLEEITNLKFELPVPHITLFTTSTREDKKQRGIGIYSQKDFESLSPQLLQ